MPPAMPVTLSYSSCPLLPKMRHPQTAPPSSQTDLDLSHLNQILSRGAIFMILLGCLYTEIKIL